MRQLQGPEVQTRRCRPMAKQQRLKKSSRHPQCLWLAELGDRPPAGAGGSECVYSTYTLYHFDC